MTTLDSDLLAWRRDWQTSGCQTTSADLQRKVVHQSHLAHWELLGSLLVTFGIGGPVALRAAQSAEPADVSLAAGTWCFIVVAWAGCLWLARGTWKASASTTSAYLDLTLARCNSWLRAVPFAIALYLGELGFRCGWELQHTDRTLSDVLTSWPFILLGWLGFPVFLLVLLRWARVKQNERDCLMNLQQQIAQAAT